MCVRKREREGELVERRKVTTAMSRGQLTGPLSCSLNAGGATEKVNLVGRRRCDVQVCECVHECVYECVCGGCCCCRGTTQRQQRQHDIILYVTQNVRSLSGRQFKNEIYTQTHTHKLAHTHTCISLTHYNEF